MTTFTACQDCQHMRLDYEETADKHVQRRYFCLAAPQPHFNFLCGTTRDFYAYCEDVNTDGHCPKFATRETPWRSTP